MPNKLKQLPEKYKAGFLREMDLRTELATRLRANYEEIIDDLGGGNAQTHVKLAMIERFVFLESVVQSLEAQIANNPKEADGLMGRWVQSVNALTGLAKVVGLERRLRKATDLRAYLAEAK
jgi:hypothetical protein